MVTVVISGGMSRGVSMRGRIVGGMGAMTKFPGLER